MISEYNGWRNYPTWNVALWIGNSESEQEFWADNTRLALEGNQFDEDSATADIARELEDYYSNYEEQGIEPLPGMFGDLFAWALRMVDWYEIAQHYVTNVIADLDPADYE